ncbi:MAG: metallophosphoesterase [Magnetococcales bacterium]|nr:metallophosphoesterase [Magnetococcales bacterium]
MAWLNKFKQWLKKQRKQPEQANEQTMVCSLQAVTPKRLIPLAKIRTLFGGPFVPLPPEEALSRLLRAHALQKRQFHPPKWLEQGHDKNSPAIIHLPDTTTPILVGDLHANLDHLLTLLTSDDILDGLAKEQVTLILLGDAVHPDRVEALGEMTGSMLMMDLIFSLIIQFPGRIVYLRGNHDGFAEDIYKGGICQGILWQECLLQARGAEYVTALQAWYDDLPYIVTHAKVVACHAAPFLAKVDRTILSKLRHYPDLLQQLTWTRLCNAQHPDGYTGKDVKRFRQALRLSRYLPMVVGHTPLDEERTCWLHAGDVDNHHVLYGGHPQRMGWLTWYKDKLFLRESRVEPLSKEALDHEKEGRSSESTSGDGD